MLKINSFFHCYLSGLLNKVAQYLFIYYYKKLLHIDIVSKHLACWNLFEDALFLSEEKHSYNNIGTVNIYSLKDHSRMFHNPAQPLASIITGSTTNGKVNLCTMFCLCRVWRQRERPKSYLWAKQFHQTSELTDHFHYT